MNNTFKPFSNILKSLTLLGIYLPPKSSLSKPRLIALICLICVMYSVTLIGILWLLAGTDGIVPTVQQGAGWMEPYMIATYLQVLSGNRHFCTYEYIEVCTIECSLEYIFWQVRSPPPDLRIRVHVCSEQIQNEILTGVDCLLNLHILIIVPILRKRYIVLCDLRDEIVKSRALVPYVLLACQSIHAADLEIIAGISMAVCQKRRHIVREIIYILETLHKFHENEQQQRIE